MQILKEDVRQSILDAACEEFSSVGYRYSSMRIIAQKAGVTVGNLYRYFKNKESILDALLFPVYTQIETYMVNECQPAILVESDNIEKFVSDLIDALSEIILGKRRELVILLNKSHGTHYEKVKGEIISYLADKIHTYSCRDGLDCSSIDIDLFAAGVASSSVEGALCILSISDDEARLQKALYTFLYAQFSACINTLSWKQ